MLRVRVIAEDQGGRLMDEWALIDREAQQTATRNGARLPFSAPECLEQHHEHKGTGSPIRLAEPTNLFLSLLDSSLATRDLSWQVLPLQVDVDNRCHVRFSEWGKR